jgi:hypothetical protein
MTYADTLKWRNEHKEQYNNYMNEYHKKFYVINAEKILKRKANHYLFKKERQRLFNIFDAFL